MRELFEVGPDSLERFVTRWYGPADRSSGVPVGVGGDAPRPLREWFELASRWSTPITVQNRVLSSPRVDAGKVVFLVESQGVWLWATDRGDGDPPVYDRENVQDRPWQPTGVPLSTFLLHVAVFEAVMGSSRGACACWVTPAQLDEILAPLRALPMPDWRWPASGHRLYAADGLLAFAGPNPGPDETAERATMRNVWVAAAESRRLEYLTGFEGVEWDFFTV
jgi:hypothetical protein